MARIAITFPPRGPGERQALAGLGQEVVWLSELDDAARRTAAGQAEAALVFWPRKELRELGLEWADFTSLRLVKTATAGVNHVGWSTLPDVPLAATPGATGPFIAEWVLGALIAWARGMPYHTAEIRQGRFHQGAPTRALSELRIGLVGYGGIGQAVARLLAPFGTRVAAVSRTGRSDATSAIAWLGTMDDLPRLVRESDALVLCLPLTRATRHLIGLDVLSGMSGRPALLVNVGRGELVVEEDLYAWLDSDGTRHAAALDVWWQYPKGEGRPFTMPFHRLPNVVMTPHNSPNVAGFREAMLAAAAADLRAFLDTGQMAHVEDPGLYRGVGGDGR